MFIIDAHLDLAYNAVRGRDLMLPARQQTPDDAGTPAVGLPDLAGAAMICATIFCEPASARGPEHGYRGPDEANAMGLAQLQWYLEQKQAGRMKIVTAAADVPQPASGHESEISDLKSQISNLKSQISSPPLPAILLLEGADALRGEDDVAAWFAAGLRIVGLAWHRTRLAGGTGEPGPLTSEGVDLVRILDRFGIIHDISHLAEESFWQLIEIGAGPVMASHSNCRSLVPGDRQLSDEMIRAIAARGGVIGINFYDKFLLPPEQRSQRRACLADAVKHARHTCDVIGDANHVGLGTDIDGGFGSENLPAQIATWGDLPAMADALRAGGFSDANVAATMGGNWAEFFRRSLPR
jgi:membrane dipeptidase